MASVQVAVPPEFSGYAEASLVRLRYLYPEVVWTADLEAGMMTAEFDPHALEPAKLVREASFQLYREKVHHDTLDIRRKLYGAI